MLRCDSVVKASLPNFPALQGCFITEAKELQGNPRLLRGYKQIALTHCVKEICSLPLIWVLAIVYGYCTLMHGEKHIWLFRPSNNIFIGIHQIPIREGCSCCLPSVLFRQKAGQSQELTGLQLFILTGLHLHLKPQLQLHGIKPLMSKGISAVVRTMETFWCGDQQGKKEKYGEVRSWSCCRWVQSIHWSQWEQEFAQPAKCWCRSQKDCRAWETRWDYLGEFVCSPAVWTIS